MYNAEHIAGFGVDHFRVSYSPSDRLSLKITLAVQLVTLRIVETLTGKSYKTFLIDIVYYLLVLP